MKIYTLECQNCGASLKIKPKQRTARCEYCDSELQIPKAMFDEINAIDSSLEARKRQEQRKEAQKQELEAFQSQRKFWNISMIAWLVIDCLLMGTDMNDNISVLHSFWPSLFFFGLAYVIAAKPKKELYIGFSTTEAANKVYSLTNKWRYGFLIWMIVMSICWGVPTDLPSRQQIFNFGMAVFIIGLVLLIKFKPSKYRKTKEEI